jgi:hypothetical protein
MSEPKKAFSKLEVPKLPPSRRVLMIKDLAVKGILYHPNHLRRLWMQDLFPRPVYPSKRRCALFEDDIDEWLFSKQAEQRTIDDERRRRVIAK